MKHIYKGLWALLACSAFAETIVTTVHPTFELWNKHTEPVYYSLSNSLYEAEKKLFIELKAGKRIVETRDTNKPTVVTIAVGNPPRAGQPVDAFVMKEHKSMFLRIGLPAEKEKFKETLKDILGRDSFETKTFIFGPQTGPLLGLKNVTERGYSLENNVSKKDIIHKVITYRP